ncbi:MAG: GNAT family N-acetyltransferase [Actinomycetota bacterium]|nr:GNAT family N-acetyltransferase [Actinomycetota bacterium]
MSWEIRPAQLDDDARLAALDRRCWSVLADVGPARAAGVPFFGPGQDARDVLVASDRRALVGWIKVVPATPLASTAHVRLINGLGVHPDRRRSGIGRALIDAAIELARDRQARKLNLRVLSTNAPAQALYAAAGFRVEGILVEEFFLDGKYVDDILMTRPLLDP